MSFFTRLSNGWTIAMNSFKVLKENKQLIIFPILSGASMLLIMASFFLFVFKFGDNEIFDMLDNNRVAAYALIFAYYIVNYFIVVFFNMALIHCTSLYFKGEEVTIKKGISFSMSRISAIFAWSLLAGSVGAVLKIIQEESGAVGKIITGLIGLVWAVATFFVVPVIAYENLGPIAAFKRSSQLMKEKWGERIGAGFSLGIINFIGVLILAAVAFFIGSVTTWIIGVAIGALTIMLLLAVTSAAQTIFISAVYHNVTGDPIEHYNQQFIDNLFVSKK